MKTRKNIICLLCSMLVILLASCEKEQTPDKINALEEGNKWTLYCRYCINPNEYDPDFYLTQEVNGDTIIEGCTYKKVYNTITGDKDDLGSHIPSILYFCQEGNKIYELSNGVRKLNYDFGLQAGDTLLNTSSGDFLVKSVSHNTMRNNLNLKHLYVARLIDYIDEPANETYDDVWIEGIGSMCNGLNYCTAGRSGVGWTLVGFEYRGEELLK